MAVGTDTLVISKGIATCSMCGPHWLTALPQRQICVIACSSKIGSGVAGLRGAISQRISELGQCTHAAAQWPALRAGAGPLCPHNSASDRSDPAVIGRLPQAQLHLHLQPQPYIYAHDYEHGEQCHIQLDNHAVQDVQQGVPCQRQVPCRQRRKTVQVSPVQPRLLQAGTQKQASENPHGGEAVPMPRRPLSQEVQQVGRAETTSEDPQTGRVAAAAAASTRHRTAKGKEQSLHNKQS
ncbi:hypothetical protein MOSE0_C05094 [Monosporozyma servazzii]